MTPKCGTRSMRSKFLPLCIWREKSEMLFRLTNRFRLAAAPTGPARIWRFGRHASLLNHIAQVGLERAQDATEFKLLHKSPPRVTQSPALLRAFRKVNQCLSQLLWEARFDHDGEPPFPGRAA